MADGVYNHDEGGGPRTESSLTALLNPRSSHAMGEDVGAEQNDDDSDDYIPESLASFLAEAEAKLVGVTSGILDDYGGGGRGGEGPKPSPGEGRAVGGSPATPRLTRPGESIEDRPTPTPRTKPTGGGTTNDDGPPRSPPQAAGGARRPADSSAAAPPLASPPPAGDRPPAPSGAGAGASPAAADGAASGTPRSFPDPFTPCTEAHGPFDTDLGSACRPNPADVFDTSADVREEAMRGATPGGGQSSSLIRGGGGGGAVAAGGKVRGADLDEEEAGLARMATAVAADLMGEGGEEQAELGAPPPRLGPPTPPSPAEDATAAALVANAKAEALRKEAAKVAEAADLAAMEAAAASAAAEDLAMEDGEEEAGVGGAEPDAPGHESLADYLGPAPPVADPASDPVPASAPPAAAPGIALVPDGGGDDGGAGLIDEMFFPNKESALASSARKKKRGGGGAKGSKLAGSSLSSSRLSKPTAASAAARKELMRMRSPPGKASLPTRGGGRPSLGAAALAPKRAVRATATAAAAAAGGAAAARRRTGTGAAARAPRSSGPAGGGGTVLAGAAAMMGTAARDATPPAGAPARLRTPEISTARPEPPVRASSADRAAAASKSPAARPRPPKISTARSEAAEPPVVRSSSTDRAAAASKSPAARPRPPKVSTTRPAAPVRASSADRAAAPVRQRPPKISTTRPAVAEPPVARRRRPTTAPAAGPSRSSAAAARTAAATSRRAAAGGGPKSATAAASKKKSGVAASQQQLPTFMSPTKAASTRIREARRDAHRPEKAVVKSAASNDAAVARARERIRQRQAKANRQAADRLGARRGERERKRPAAAASRGAPKAALTTAQRRKAGKALTTLDDNVRWGAAEDSAAGGDGAKTKAAATAEKGRDTEEAASEEGAAKEAVEAEAEAETVAVAAAAKASEQAREMGPDRGAGVYADAEAPNPASDAENLPMKSPGCVSRASSVENRSPPPASAARSPVPAPAQSPSFERARRRMDMHRQRMESAHDRRPRLSILTERANADAAGNRARSAIDRPFVPHKSPRKITVPDPPRLSTLERLGDKATPSQSLDGEGGGRRQHESSFASHSTYAPGSLTEPEPFHLSYMDRVPPPHASTPKPASPTLAERVERYLRDGPRDFSTPGSSSALTAGRRHLTPTVPRPFNLSKGTPKELPKSTAELEEEEAAYITAHQFRARSVGHGVLGGQGGGEHGVPKVPKRDVTTPSPFRLHTETRNASALPRPPTTEELQALECLNQFHAMPLPDLTHRPPSVPRSARRAREVTTPKPFKLRGLERHEAVPPPPPTADEVEMAKQFRAHSVPPSLYRPPSSAKRRPDADRVLTTPEAPRLATAERQVEARQTMEELARQNVEHRIRERQREALQRQREEQREFIEMSNGYTTPRAHTATVPEPFNFASDSRHKAHRAHTERQMLRELDEIRRQAESFRARPIPSSTRRPMAELIRTPRAERALTEQEPFHLESLRRHMHAQEALLAKVELEEEERRRHAVVRATPLPVSTFRRPPAHATPTRELVQPVGPSLRTDSQARHREEFDRECQRRREEEAAAKLALEEQRREEMEREMWELRRRPVSEGGLMQVARPIGAVFTFRGHGDPDDAQNGNGSSMGQPVPAGE